MAKLEYVTILHATCQVNGNVAKLYTWSNISSKLKSHAWRRDNYEENNLMLRLFQQVEVIWKGTRLLKIKATLGGKGQHETQYC